MADAARQQSGRRASKPSPERTIARSARLDSVIHERTRLAIVSALAANERLSFVELKALLDATDGNVSAHARRLEDAGYVQTHKRFEGRVPRTEYELTAEGREALERYLAHMEALIEVARGG
ncbi:MAG: transcriptional regulator [Dehalococcoidia bacterium]|nr:transcriptional regulator [Dehalococcoidia bacterium]